MSKGDFVDESEAKRCWYKMHNLDTTAERARARAELASRGIIVVSA